MKPSQIRLYRASWAPVAAFLRDLGGFTAAEVEEERRAILLEATGKTSSKDLTQGDLDRVLDAHERAAALIQGPSTSNRAEEQPLKRLIYAIEQLGLPPGYLERISLDQFGTSNWRSLTVRQLTRFRYTATQRARSKARS